MGKRKKWLAFLTAMLMFAGIALQPLQAEAVNGGPNIPDLGIGDIRLEGDTYYLLQDDGIPTKDGADENKYNVYVSQAGSETVLTLKDAELKSALYVPGNTSIALNGENSIEGSGTGIQVQTSGSLVLKGEGSIAITAGTEAISNGDGDITIAEKAKVYVHDGYTGIYAPHGNITICDNAYVECNNSNSGRGEDAISAGTFTSNGGVITVYDKDLLICDNATVVANRTLDAQNKIIVKDNAKVTAEVNVSKMGMKAQKGIDILKGATVVAKGSTGINSFCGVINIEGKATATGTSAAAVSSGQGDTSTGRSGVKVTGTLTVLGGLLGIGNSEDGVSIDGGTVTMENVQAGIISAAGIDISNRAEVTIDAGVYGFRADGGAISIADSTVTSGGGNKAFAKAPVLNYTKGCRVDAGADADSAALVNSADLTDDTYTGNAYVKIQPATVYEVVVEESDADNSGAGKYIEGNTVKIDAGEREGYTFSGWSSADDVIFENEAEAATSFVMPGKDVTVTANWNKNEPKLLEDVADPDPITGIANGTEKTAEALGLPEEVTIETDDESIATASVKWDLENLAEGSYDPLVKTEQTFVINGTVILPEGVSADGKDLTIQITVTVSAAGVTAAPVFDISGGSYKENQKLTLTCPAEGAVIYYTTDGSEPTEDSAKYEGPIALEGIVGESVEITVKVIAVADGMQSSKVISVTYVIDLSDDGSEEPEKPEEPIEPEVPDKPVVKLEAQGGQAKPDEPVKITVLSMEVPDGVTIALGVRTPENPDRIVKIVDYDPKNPWEVIEYTPEDGEGNYTFIIYNVQTGEEYATLTVQVGDVGTSREEPEESVCKHEYEWVPEKAATTLENAWEVYQCKYCGRVKARMDVANSAYAEFNKNAVKEIDKAPVNGTVTVSTPLWVSFQKSVIETLKGRPDVTVVLNYRFKGERYTLTIPAGTDLDVLEESEGYYGFRYLDTIFAGQKID